jgi:hypothetical protein
MKRRSASKMCIEPPRPREVPSTRPKISAITRRGSVGDVTDEVTDAVDDDEYDDEWAGDLQFWRCWPLPG